MGTTIRAEVSKRNRYWIEKQRYYELKHFCLQYPVWKKICLTLDGLSRSDIGEVLDTNNVGDPVFRCVSRRERYTIWMGMIEKAAKETDEVLGYYVLKGVTEGWPYDILKARLEIPCGKDMYYDLYRKFFWILDALRE